MYAVGDLILIAQLALLIIKNEKEAVIKNISERRCENYEQKNYYSRIR